MGWTTIEDRAGPARQPPRDPWFARRHRAKPPCAPESIRPRGRPSACRKIALPFDQLAHAAANLVADRSHGLDRLPLGVLERPVFPLRPRHDGTLVTAP